jgi:hypothetical protein
MEDSAFGLENHRYYKVTEYPISKEISSFCGSLLDIGYSIPYQQNRFGDSVSGGGPGYPASTL